MMMLRIFLRTLCLLCLLNLVSVHAQTASLLYEVEDLLSGQKFKERWTVTQDSVDPDILQTAKVTQVQAPTTVREKSIESPYWWKRETRPERADEYYKEFLSTPPHLLNPGETTFGYVNLHEVKTDTIIESWPLFITVEMQNKLKKIIFTVYISNNRIMEVERFYTEDIYIFPLIQQVKIYKPGVDPKSVPLIGVRNHYFEAFVVTSVTKQN